MSIRDGLLNNGDPVYAAQGEELRGRDIFCKHCGARMHLTKYPLRDEYYFSCCPGEEHRADVCRNYEAERVGVEAPPEARAEQKSPKDTSLKVLQN